MRDPIVRKAIRVSSVNVHPGECLTVYLQSAPYTGRETDSKGAQVELRVLEDGTMEIFADEDAPLVQPFKKWYWPERKESNA